jgi:phosphate acetyltransferase
MIPDQLRARVKQRRLPLALPEGDDERIAAAALHLVQEGLARPILICEEPQALVARFAAAGCREDAYEVFTAGSSVAVERHAAIVSARREGMNEGMAARLLRRPLYLGGAMVAAGTAAAMVAGVAHPTRRVIEACLMTIGLANGVDTLSSFDLVLLHDPAGASPRMFVFSDCSVNIDPTATELADIAIASADSARSALGAEPRVALLSFSTHGSASHARASKVRSAVDIVRQRRPDIAVDGEIQVDAAVSESVARLKVRAPGRVAGQANVLVFPDLDAGNIAAKLLQYLGGASIVGSVLQGLARPVADLSRGADVREIVETAVLTLAVASGGEPAPSAAR